MIEIPIVAIVEITAFLFIFLALFVIAMLVQFGDNDAEYGALLFAIIVDILLFLCYHSVIVFK